MPSRHEEIMVAADVLEEDGHADLAAMLRKDDETLWGELKAEIKMMLHAHRDCLRNQLKNTERITFNVRDGYYGEAFGILRAMAIVGLGQFQASNLPAVRSNLKWWMHKLEDEVLEEENFGGSGVCKWCLEKYHKDDATVRKHREKAGSEL